MYLVYSSFGLLAPFWWGHHGYHGATYMLRARMSLRLHMLSPATWGGFETPPPAALYFHHPIGYHHILTLLIPIFGDHEWLARGVAVAGGLHPEIRGEYFRVGHMGYVVHRPDLLRRTVEAVAAGLQDLGRKVDGPAAWAAAESV